MKTVLLFILLYFLTSCSNNIYKNNFLERNYSINKRKLNNSIFQIAYNIEKIWGKSEILVVGPKDYVKYSDQYKTRSHINFNIGYIVIETITINNVKNYLRKAIVNTLLMGSTPDDINFYSDSREFLKNKKPFLYGQVLDNYNKPISWKWKAVRFADFLIKNCLKKRITNNFKKVWFVTIKLVPDHVNKRVNKYLNIVRKYSKKYGIDQSLILAIIQIESSFNPYAVSRNNALGLMQIMQKSAGRDVFKMKKKTGQPSQKYLFDPSRNIDIGTAYLYMLQNIYLNRIINLTSRKYVVISSYNSGINNVLKIFSYNQKKAFNTINKMHPKDVYQKLYTKHPLIESRMYLHKVNKLQKLIKIMGVKKIRYAINM